MFNNDEFSYLDSLMEDQVNREAMYEGVFDKFKRPNNKAPNAQKILKRRLKELNSVSNLVDKATDICTKSAAHETDAGCRSSFTKAAKSLATAKTTLAKELSKWADTVRGDFVGESGRSTMYDVDSILESVIFAAMEDKDSAEEQKKSSIEVAIASIEEAIEGSDKETKEKLEEVVDSLKDIAGIEDSDDEDDDKKDKKDDKKDDEEASKDDNSEENNDDSNSDENKSDDNKEDNKEGSDDESEAKKESAFGIINSLDDYFDL